MALIKSISGIRGTIGGRPGVNLTPEDLVRLTAAYARHIKEKGGVPHVLIGRDGRMSGESVSGIVAHTLVMMGINVTDLGHSTTPTVEMAVVYENAGGGMVLSASHNPKEWNALKLLNEKGEFLSNEEGETVLKYAEETADYAMVDELGTYRRDDSHTGRHIEAILRLRQVLIPEIQKAGLKVVVDCINSSGARAIPPLLDKLGVEYLLLNEKVDGNFAHDPEPLPANLGQLMDAVSINMADLGIAVDPDVDRLALVSEDGSYFGEEYTLVAVADYLLAREPGPVVTNLSSTFALADIAARHKCKWGAAAVGEVNVVAKMKAMEAVLGGEGNGGIIYPALHYGRDALVGIALFLSGLASKKLSASEWRAQLPNYYMSKEKARLNATAEPDELLDRLKDRYADESIDTTDGLKIYFDREWVHMRKSNTEPIIRIYAESVSLEKAVELNEKFKSEIEKLLRGS